MPPDNYTSLLDQLEEWLEAQVPPNLHELPYRMLETMERVSNELFETLNIHGPPSISIPFPPFTAKEPPPPPPPPKVPPLSLVGCKGWAGSTRAGKLARAHPYVVAGGAVLALTVGLGVGAAVFKRVYTARRNVSGRVDDGMLKDAIVLLAPSPMPPMIWPLAVSLLRAGYVVIVAVPNVEDAEQLEKRLGTLEEKGALRVLIYDTEDPSTFPAFHRSLLATLTLRFPAVGQHASDPYIPQPAHSPAIHAYISLYPLHPCPPSQPGALPAIPTLLAPNPDGRVPKLITLYPSTSVLTQPDSFASQILTANHELLSSNLEAFTSARVVSVYVGNVYLPRLHSLLLPSGPQLTRRQQARLQLQQASTAQKASIIKDYIIGGLKAVWYRLGALTGIGHAGQDYALFESSLLRVIRNDSYGRQRYHLGQYSYLSLFLSRLPVPILPYILRILPTLPTANGPLTESVQGLPAPRKPLGNSSAGGTTNTTTSGTPFSSGGNTRGPRPAPASASTYGSRSQAGSRAARAAPAPASQASNASSSEHEDDAEGDYLASSFHTTGTTSSRGHAGSERSGSSRDGLGDSWVGLDAVGASAPLSASASGSGSAVGSASVEL